VSKFHFHFVPRSSSIKVVNGRFSLKQELCTVMGGPD
jgi:hypothetical protein